MTALSLQLYYQLSYYIKVVTGVATLSVQGGVIRYNKNNKERGIYYATKLHARIQKEDRPPP